VGRERENIPLGYRSKLKSRIFWPMEISTPSNVKLERTRWKIRSVMSQITRRTPSSATFVIRNRILKKKRKTPTNCNGSFALSPATSTHEHLQSKLPIALVPKELDDRGESPRHETEDYVGHPDAEVNSRAEVAVDGGVFEGCGVGI
jgi:hypothetical protein